MNEGQYIGFGRCWSCRRQFTFDPELVPSVPIDPVTGLPPDVDEQIRQVEPVQLAIERAVKQPLCRNCVELVNAVRVEKIYVPPGAYSDE